MKKFMLLTALILGCVLSSFCQTWQIEDIPLSNPLSYLETIYVGPDSNGVVGGINTILQCKDGKSWEEVDSILPDHNFSMIASDGTSSTNMSLVGDSGKIFYNDGSNWSYCQLESKPTLMTVLYTGQNEVYIGGYGYFGKGNKTSFVEIPIDETWNSRKCFLRILSTNDSNNLIILESQFKNSLYDPYWKLLKFNKVTKTFSVLKEKFGMSAFEMDGNGNTYFISCKTGIYKYDATLNSLDSLISITDQHFIRMLEPDEFLMGGVFSQIVWHWNKGKLDTMCLMIKFGGVSFYKDNKIYLVGRDTAYKNCILKIKYIKKPDNITEDKPKIEIDPNPTSNFLNVHSNDQYNISNMMGQILLPGKNGPVIDVSNLEKGCYIITKTKLSGSVTKFLKQ